MLRFSGSARGRCGSALIFQIPVYLRESYFSRALARRGGSYSDKVFENL